MNVYGMNPDGHDGAITLIKDGDLAFLVESEKLEGRHRSSPLRAQDIFDHVLERPGAVGLAGWGSKGYSGLESKVVHKTYFGHKIPVVEVSHELSHIMGGVAMSPFRDTPVFVLLWEGTIGSFYHVSADFKVTRLINNIVDRPGQKFESLYLMGMNEAERAVTSGTSAGTLMALAAYGDLSLLKADGRKLVERLLGYQGRVFARGTKKLTFEPLVNSRFNGIGVTTPEFQALALHLSNEIFRRFYAAIKQRITNSLPLIIVGGCGLNCDWNTRWAASELFSDVFVPPIANDSGSAFGAAAEAQRRLTGSPYVTWNVYAGPWFIENSVELFGSPLRVHKVTPKALATVLHDGNLVPVAYGRAEIGPRALGHRSILAAPFKGVAQRLNQIKGRQSFRPVAPMVCVDTAHKYFSGRLNSPHMLYFQQVFDCILDEVTHVDNTARLQLVDQSENFLYQTLREFGELGHPEVLCNTSLNDPGRGFIPDTRSVFEFCMANSLKWFVAGSFLFEIDYGVVYESSDTESATELQS